MSSTLIVIPTARAIELILFELSGKSDWQIEYIGTGASSLAWRASCGSEDWLVRAMDIESEKPMTYPQELALLDVLHQFGLPISEPIVHSKASDISFVAFPWAITRFVQGTPLKNTPLAESAAYQLGEIFAVLHHIPVENWGWVFHEQGRFLGKQSTAHAGALERWSNHPLFPLDATALESHPLSYNAEYFIPHITELLPDLLQAAQTGSPAICHSDLHGAHLLMEGERLSALIDFGDACSLPPAWDFAILAYYYGWQACSFALDAYAAPDKENFIRQTIALSIITALQKFNRQYRRQAPIIQRAMSLRFLQNSLEHWQGRPFR